MRVLVVHNRYQQPGGEDAVVEREVTLLRQHGHKVGTWTDDNARIASVPKTRLALDTIWSTGAYRALKQLASGVDIVHFHNTLPLISPSGYYAAREADAAIVQTLHNYRLVCPAAILYRDGHICQECVGRAVPWPAVAHACYRNSRAASGTIASMLVVHRAAGTWHRAVDAYIALTPFVRDTLVEGGLPRERIHLKPNFVERAAHAARPERARSFLFVGRLSPEKGVSVLVDAWRAMGSTAPPLRIAGDGPESSALRKRAEGIHSIEWLGQCAPETIATLMSDSAALIVPSLWYEAFPAVVAEAFAAGLPVVASNLGSLASIVEERQNGVLFAANDSSSLARCVLVLADDGATRGQMGRRARAIWEERYSPEVNHALLMDIYDRARVTRAGNAATPRPAAQY